MSPKELLLRKINKLQQKQINIQSDIDELFELANSFCVDSDEEGRVEPVKFRRPHDDSLSNAYNGIVMEVRKKFNMSDGGPIPTDWFEFLFDLEKRRIRPDVARKEVGNRLHELKRKEPLEVLF